MAVVLRLGGRTSFFNYGWADRVNEKPVTTDSLFNLASLRKVFDATLLARSVRDGALRLDDSIAKYVSELQVIFAASRSASSPPTPPACCYLKTIRLWPDWGYTLPEFIRTLNACKAEKEPGEEHLYTHAAGFILLQLAMERRYGKPI